MISTKGKYALKIMLDIAVLSDGEKAVSLKTIADNRSLPQKYIEQVGNLLARAGLVRSVRGNNGGYKLVKDISDYSIYEILKAVETSVTPVPDLDHDSLASGSTEMFWNEYNNVVIDFLSHKTLANIVADYKINNDIFDYSI